MQNFVNITGNLTRDIETIHTNGGTTLAKFSVAVNDGFGDKKKSYFFDCTAFNDTADKIAQYFEKGKRIEIIGRLQQETWESEGQKRSKVSIIVDRWDFAGGNKPADVPSAESGEKKVASPKTNAAPVKKSGPAPKNGKKAPSPPFETEDDGDNIDF